VWKDSKGYELVYKYCECNCRRGCLKKDIDYVNEVLTIYAPMIYTACVHIHYVGKWEGVGPWNSRVFWAL
jgi:hypothetical protein